MADIPYIIVDNRRIPPVEPPQRSSRSADEREANAEDSFGIVDRVTLSKEGIRRSREEMADADVSPVDERLSVSRGTSPPMLTYSPKLLRR